MVHVEILFDKTIELTLGMDKQQALNQEVATLASMEYGVSSDEGEVVTTINAQQLINQSRKMLCNEIQQQVHGEGHELKDGVYRADPIMAHAMVPECFYRGGMCPYQNPKGCNENVKYLRQLIGTIPEAFYRDARNEAAVNEGSLLLEER